MRPLLVIDTETQAIKLRGHTLLCLQGFRGLGYSSGFVENLSRIHNELRTNNETPVEVLDTIDAVCEACPHESRTTGCTLNGAQTEAAIQAQDRLVLKLLGLRPGESVTWKELLRRISIHVSGDDLPTICGQCRWLSLGYCSSGIDQLRGGP